MEKLITQLADVKPNQEIRLTSRYFKGPWPKKLKKGDDFLLWVCGDPIGITVVETNDHSTPTVVYGLRIHIARVLELNQDKIGSIKHFTNATIIVENMAGTYEDYKHHMGT